MKINKKYNKKFVSGIALASVIAMSPLASNAQYNQSISVDGKYVPEIFRLDRINSFPKQVKFSLTSTPLSYDGKSVPAGFAPKLLPLPATGWQDNRLYSDSRGYLELGAGSWLNSTLSAGYRFVDNENTTFGVRLQHNSTSLWKPELSEATKDIRQYRYDETLGFYASHDFSGKGRLQGAIDWHIGNFNYYGFCPSWLGQSLYKRIDVPSQTLNDISARFSWQSPDKQDDIVWNAGAGVRYFGYRSYYYSDMGVETTGWGMYTKRMSGGRETDINLNGSIAFPTSTKSTIGLDMNADIILYPQKKELVGGSRIWAPDNYGFITLNPYYSFSKDKLLVRIGADIDLNINAGEDEAESGIDDSGFSFLHIAPDVKIDYLAGPVALYLHALGGSRLNTLAANYELDYYQTPAIGSSRPVYSPLDGSLGATFGPFSGFSAGVDFAFRISNGIYTGGWYQTRLNDISRPDGLPTDIIVDGEEYPLYYSTSNSHRYNLRGFSIGAHLSYDLGKVLKIEAKGNYQKQGTKVGYFNGYDRPRITANISVETNPWSTLKFKVGYDYRGVRGISTYAYIPSNIPDGIKNMDDILMSMRLPDLTLLNFGASYGFSKNFNVWLQADNILNRHDDYLPGLPMQGISITAGIGVTF